MIPDQDTNIVSGCEKNTIAFFNKGNQLIYLKITDDSIKEVQQESLRDYDAKRLQDIIKQGWTEQRSMVTKDLQDFWSFKDKLRKISS